jgi:hypothetical protein
MLQAADIASKKTWRAPDIAIKKVAGSSHCKQQMWLAAAIASNKCGRQQLLQATKGQAAAIASNKCGRQQIFQTTKVAGSSYCKQPLIKKLVGVVRMLYFKGTQD